MRSIDEHVHLKNWFNCCREKTVSLEELHTRVLSMCLYWIGPDSSVSGLPALADLSSKPFVANTISDTQKCDDVLYIHATVVPLSISIISATVYGRFS